MVAWRPRPSPPPSGRIWASSTTRIRLSGVAAVKEYYIKAGGKKEKATQRLARKAWRAALKRGDRLASRSDMGGANALARISGMLRRLHTCV